ncbi:MAG: type II toxin-antitoxin system RelE/ParE family toxin [Acidimicrobiales bacterium]
MAWVIVLLEEVDVWYRELWNVDAETAALVTAAINLLEDNGPSLGRPLVDRIEGSKLHNLKELRPGSAGVSEVRILFMFDPERQAVLLVAGDKRGQWSAWYTENIPVAEARYERWLSGEYNDEIGG